MITIFADFHKYSAKIAVFSITKVMFNFCHKKQNLESKIANFLSKNISQIIPLVPSLLQYIAEVRGQFLTSKCTWAWSFLTRCEILYQSMKLLCLHFFGCPDLSVFLRPYVWRNKNRTDVDFLHMPVVNNWHIGNTYQCRLHWHPILKKYNFDTPMFLSITG
jgi:hypothetical protein